MSIHKNKNKNKINIPVKTRIHHKGNNTKVRCRVH